MSRQNLCKDCKHEDEWTCGVTYKAPTNGADINELACFRARRYEIHCGASARFFEGKEKPDCRLCSNLFRKGSSAICDECNRQGGSSFSQKPQQPVKTICNFHYDDCPENYNLCEFYEDTGGGICNSEQKQQPVNEMWLEVDEAGVLTIRASGSPMGRGLVGYIHTEGDCRILNNGATVKNYNQWRKDGMHVREQEPVEWRGGEYHIDTLFQLYRTMMGHGGYIYDFEECGYMDGCQDENIIRFPHNNRPVGF